MGGPAENLRCGAIPGRSGPGSRVDRDSVWLRVFGSEGSIYNGCQQPGRGSLDVETLLM